MCGKVTAGLEDSASLSSTRILAHMRGVFWKLEQGEVGVKLALL